MKLFTALVSVCLATGCASVPPTKMTVDYDTQALERMKGYRTYAWLPEPADSIDRGGRLSDLDLERFKQAIAAELTELGFEVSTTSPDFRVGYDGTLQRKLVTSGGDTRYGVGFGTGGAGVGVSFGGSGSSTTYDEGTLTVGVIDADTGKLVWQGIAQGAVRPSATPQDREKQLRRIARDILEQFPPGAK